MQDIQCPNCGKVFKVDEAGFADILRQVRNSQFEKELQKRVLSLEEEKESAVKLAEANIKNLMQSDIAKKEKEMLETKAQWERDLAEQKEEITNLKTKIESAEIEKKVAIMEAVNPIEKQCDNLKIQLQSKDQERDREIISLKDKYENELKGKDEMIEYYKDLKVKLNTKMVGETLEQHCKKIGRAHV